MKCKKIVCILLSVLLFSLCGCGLNNDGSFELYIFENIEECQGIVENKTDDAIVTLMETPDNDKHLKDLSYSAFWGCEYKADDLEFTFYAYVFEDNDTANKYFRNVTGKKNDLEKNFSYSWSMNTPRLIVLSDNRIYKANTIGKYSDATINYLNAIFTEEIYQSREKTGDGSLS